MVAASGLLSDMILFHIIDICFSQCNSIMVLYPVSFKAK